MAIKKLVLENFAGGISTSRYEKGNTYQDGVGIDPLAILGSDGASGDDARDIGEIRVAKSWFEAEGVVKEDLRLSSYVGGSWVDVETIFLSEDDDAYFFTAEITDFGFFTIGELTAEVVDGGETGTGEEEGVGLGIAAWIGIIIGIIVVVALIIFLMKGKKKLVFL